MGESQKHKCTKIERFWQCFHKPYATCVFSQPVCDALLNSYKNEKPITWTRSNILRCLIPTVHAQEAVAKQQDGGTLTLTDQVMRKKPANLIGEEEIQNYLDAETGRHRLKVMFTKSDKNAYSPELELVTSTIKTASLITFVIASSYGGIHARDEFIKTHQHVKFPTKFRAVRAYQDAILLGGLKFGAQWALKTGFFVALLSTTSQSIAVYRNKTSPLEYTAGGMLTGSLLRMNLGLKGMFAGGIIGGVFGLVGGILIWGMMKLNGETQEQRHYWEVHDILRQKKEIQAITPAPETS